MQVSLLPSLFFLLQIAVPIYILVYTVQFTPRINLILFKNQIQKLSYEEKQESFLYASKKNEYLHYKYLCKKYTKFFSLLKLYIFFECQNIQRKYTLYVQCTCGVRYFVCAPQTKQKSQSFGFFLLISKRKVSNVARVVSMNSSPPPSTAAKKVFCFFVGITWLWPP